MSLACDEEKKNLSSDCLSSATVYLKSVCLVILSKLIKNKRFIGIIWLFLPIETDGTKCQKQDSVLDPGLGPCFPQRTQVQSGSGYLPDYES